ncbi:lantibiotic protection ABC transporter ATP-binding protein [Adlercreutzia sp. ZJ138]|uniref:lantibiotic protection ABC transporter ATP-binding protein n=1 Tax=Adlercreutzia sp. ZJ138 TaxID=2709405 RepID=UPI0013EDC3D6|nr:lantibiotic protection ABC transporter ATP-binding protein [Adlercreutzia sp. ZJ138]
MGNVLETRNLTKRFGRRACRLSRNSEHNSDVTYAVQGVSLHVPEGVVYGLLGPNGAGKSTTLKMIAGMLHPTSGTIIFDGHPWQRADLYRIGALIENPPLYPNLTARENLRVRTMMLGIPEARIDDVLRMVDLTDTGSKRTAQFSMGMKQRLGIALALLGQPKLLILDEPTNGLDPMGVEDIRHLIRALPERGISVIVSSHILAEVSHVADKVGIITEGKLAFEGLLAPGTDLEHLFMSVCRRAVSERMQGGPGKAEREENEAANETVA